MDIQEKHFDEFEKRLARALDAKVGSAFAFSAAFVACIVSFVMFFGFKGVIEAIDRQTQAIVEHKCK